MSETEKIERLLEEQNKLLTDILDQVQMIAGDTGDLLKRD